MQLLSVGWHTNHGLKGLICVSWVFIGKTWYVEIELGELCFVGNMRLYWCLCKMVTAFLDCAVGREEKFIIFFTYFLFPWGCFPPLYATFFLSVTSAQSVGKEKVLMDQIMAQSKEATNDFSSTEEATAWRASIREQSDTANWFLFPILQFGKSLIPPATSPSDIKQQCRCRTDC